MTGSGDARVSATATEWRTESRFYRRSPGLGWLLGLLLIPLLFGPVLLIGSITLLGMGSPFASLGDGDPEIAALFGVGGVVLSLITGFLVTVGFTLWVGCSASRPGENRFGAEPMTAVLV